jgi:hypothetical protein
LMSNQTNRIGSRRLYSSGGPRALKVGAGASGLRFFARVQPKNLQAFGKNAGFKQFLVVTTLLSNTCIREGSDSQFSDPKAFSCLSERPTDKTARFMNEPPRSELYDHARTDLLAGTRFYEPLAH